MNSENIKTYSIIGTITALVLVLGLVLMVTEDSPSSNNLEKDSQNSGSLRSVDGPLIGTQVSEVKLFDKEGKEYDFESLKGRKAVLFFSEGLMCYPACWNQIVQLSQDARFNTDEVVAISVVADDPQDWQKAIEKMPELGKAQMLYDRSGQSSRAMGLLDLGSSMHKGQMPGHTYLMIDKEGIIKEIYDDPYMGINNDKIVEKILSL